MWMTQYIVEIKKQFRDVYGFVPSRVIGNEPCFDDIPDGEYPMAIDGKLDRVKMAGGKISCCNFDTPAPPTFCGHGVNQDYPCLECQAAGIAAPAEPRKER